NPISLRQLQSLEPHLDRMSREEVLFLGWETEREIGLNEGVAEWIRTHLVPRLPAEERARVQVADEMLIDTLNRFFRDPKFGPHVGFLFEERGGQRFVFPERQLRVLDEWLSNHRTVRGLQLTAECLKQIGTRLDLGILSHYPIEGDASEIERIIADAKFSVWKRTLT